MQRKSHHGAGGWDRFARNGLVKVSFAPAKDTMADVGTKNVTGDIMDCLRPKLMVSMPQEHQMGNQDQTMEWDLRGIESGGCWNAEFAALNTEPGVMSHGVVVRMIAKMIV